MIDWKKQILCILLIAVSLYSNAQMRFIEKDYSHELNVGVGFAYYFGDLNTVNQGKHPFTFITEANNFKSFKMSYSLGYRFNFPERYSLGFNIQHLYLSAYDSDNESSIEFDEAFYRKVRNLDFHTSVNKLGIDFRYEHFRTEERWNNKKWLLSPYVQAGIGVFFFNPKTFYKGQEIALQPLGTEGQGSSSRPSRYSLAQICIPISLGMKYIEPLRRYSIGIDFTYNYTFTDYLDDVSSSYASSTILSSTNNSSNAPLAIALANRNFYGNDPKYSYITGPNQQRGNPDHNDNFLTGQLTFSIFLDAFGPRYLKF